MRLELHNAHEVAGPIAISNDRNPDRSCGTAIVEPTTSLSVNRLELVEAGRLELDDLDETSHDPSLSGVPASVPPQGGTSQAPR
jgi:hypothetical protein